MILNIFSKAIAGDKGVFYNYFTKLTDKEGNELSCKVKFRQECGAPKGDSCPRVIEVDKHDANLVKKTITYIPKNETEEKEVEERTLWVSSWKDKGEYIDHSLDDFVD